MARKPDSSRLNVLFIIYVLSNYSDQEHPLSASDIKKYIDAEFDYLSNAEDGAVISVDTVKRVLEELTDKVFPSGIEEGTYKIEYRFGYYIHCVMEDGDGFTSYRVKEGQQPPKKYYYYESSLKLAELITLKDAIETYCFFSEEDITGIIQKLIKLRPRAFAKSKYHDVASAERDENSLLLMNIEDLNRIINNKSGAKITYCHYNKYMQLEPRDGYPKVMEPVHLMWSNGYYYLLAYNLKYNNIVSMRVDRITDIEEVELEKKHGRETFNPVKYRHEHPVMFSGEKKQIVMLCRDTGSNYIMNSIVDVFGKNVRVVSAEENLLKQYIPNYNEDKKNGVQWLKVTVNTTLGGLEMWATQYCADCVVVSPEELRQQVKQNLKQGMSYYS